MYEIVTDSGCNLSHELIKKNNIYIVPLYLIVDGEPHANYLREEDEEKIKGFYESLRNKTPMSTSCVNQEVCEETFSKILDSGKDLLYISMSTGISASYMVASKILDELKLKYPNRKIYHVDSLCAALGQGLLVLSIADIRDRGGSVEEAYDFAENNKLKVCHLFTVETLTYLYRGGRVKKSAKLLADTLNIKPIMYANSNGYIAPLGKVFGRKMSLNSIAKRAAENIINPETQTLYIAHGDCIKDAEYLAARIKDKISVKEVAIQILDMVIGTHSGPGTIALFYYGNGR